MPFACSPVAATTGAAAILRLPSPRLLLRPKSFTLDGEAVVCGPDGVAIFDALHRRGTITEAVLYAFDLLELDGEDLRGRPLGDPKKRLARLLGGRRLGIARTVAAIGRNAKFIEGWPDNQRYWRKSDGSSYRPGDTISFPTLARTLTRMVEAERAHKAEGRSAGIVAARDRFYKGDIAAEMVAFLGRHETPFEIADFAEFFARIDEPAVTTYRGYEVYKHSFGGQGPALLEALKILENFDLRAMKLNSPDYLHTVVEALKLAYADRDTYYGDPAFVQVPGEGLLSKAYAKERARLIDPNHASRAFVAGNPLPFDSHVKTWPYWVANLGAAA